MFKINIDRFVQYYFSRVIVKGRICEKVKLVVNEMKVGKNNL